MSPSALGQIIAQALGLALQEGNLLVGGAHEVLQTRIVCLNSSANFCCSWSRQVSPRRSNWLLRLVMESANPWLTFSSRVKRSSFFQDLQLLAGVTPKASRGQLIHCECRTGFMQSPRSSGRRA